MKKWLIVIGIICLVTIGQLLLLYRGFKKVEVTRAEEALATAHEKVNLSWVQSVEYYPGDGGHHVIVGKDDDGQHIIIWIQDEKYVKETVSAGKSRKDILSQLPAAEIKRAIPGLMTDLDGKKRAIWDVYYINDEGQRLYEYFDFYTGDKIKTIALSS